MQLITIDEGKYTYRGSFVPTCEKYCINSAMNNYSMDEMEAQYSIRPNLREEVEGPLAGEQR